MDGLLGAVAFGVFSLVAWRWWLTDRAEARRVATSEAAEERQLRKESLRVDMEEIRKLPARITELESSVKALGWKK